MKPKKKHNQGKKRQLVKQQMGSERAECLMQQLLQTQCDGSELRALGRHKPLF